MKKLNIQSRGMIKGGFIEYECHQDGRVDYRGEISVKMWFFSKTVPLLDSYKASPELLRSESYVQGADLNLGRVDIHVDIVSKDGENKAAQVRLKLDGVSCGNGILNLSDDLMSIKMIDVRGKVNGYDFELYANE